ncbi:metallophosphoesterase family protein [Frankia sp. Cppng1_Ct_nod]|uniref:metallophosphoesterase family protein n=1 Tax=Frankia sp. Cppng1_Ct_nod TaxID=2897162 RepID=UPI00104183CC|nr:metallophosphoesterase family protein [Frankia sp. Cppng1_Ct_nod]
MTTWYTADLHFGHTNILTYASRPWPDVEAMNAGLVKLWNAVVAPTDTVWVLGDVTLTPTKLDPVADLNGRKILVAGNHDSCWSGHRRHAGQASRYVEAGFADIHASGVVRDHRIGNQLVTLAHFPYRGDHTAQDRYADRRPQDDGRPLLCGHVHDAWQVHDRQINVGVDVWDWTPVSEKAVLALMETMPG